MEIINCTPHELSVIAKDGEVVTVPPSGIITRLSEERKPAGIVIMDDGTRIDATAAEHGGIVDLPEMQSNTIFVVSAMVRMALRNRIDVFSPGVLVRDAAGNIIGCQGLTAGETAEEAIASFALDDVRESIFEGVAHPERIMVSVKIAPKVDSYEVLASYGEDRRFRFAKIENCKAVFLTDWKAVYEGDDPELVKLLETTDVIEVTPQMEEQSLETLFSLGYTIARIHQIMAESSSGIERYYDLLTYMEENPEEFNHPRWVYGSTFSRALLK